MMRFILRLLSVVAFAVCAAPFAAAQNATISIDFHSYDEYRALLARAERAFESNEIDELQFLVKMLALFDVPETPTYQWRVFNAVVLGARGEAAAAQSELAAFDDMLRIDSGVWKCGAAAGSITRNGAIVQSPIAYRQMCAEIYLSYYESPTAGTLKDVTEQWSLVASVRQTIGNGQKR